MAGTPQPGRPASEAPGLAEIVSATSSHVWRLHAHMVGPEDADDLSQETYLRVLKALPAFRGDASVRTWVLAIATRVAADEIRRRQRGRRLLQRLAGPVEEATDPTGFADVWALLRTLDPERREAFVLTQVLGLSYEEAARLAGCPIGTIRSRVARARGDLLRGLRGMDG